jgi:hypothetical protein
MYTLNKKNYIFILQLECLNFKLKIKMAYDGFDNINQLELQAAIEVEIDLFENSRSGPTYTNMESPTFQPLLVPQQQFKPNILQQQQQFQPNISTTNQLNQQIQIQVSHLKT